MKVLKQPLLQNGNTVKPLNSGYFGTGEITHYLGNIGYSIRKA